MIKCYAKPRKKRCFSRFIFNDYPSIHCGYNCCFSYCQSFKQFNVMKNSTALIYIGAIIATFIGMFIHIRLMIITNEFEHFVCFFLWMVIGGGLVLLFNHKLEKN